MTQTKLNVETDEEIIYVDGWKGKDEISIYESQEPATRIFKIVEHRKDKESGDIVENIKVVDREDVVFLWNIIRNLELGEKYGYKYLVRQIIQTKNVHEAENMSVESMMIAFNGGAFRAKYYFPLYYYPMKVLEAKGYVQYFGRGGCARLENGEFT